MQTDISQSEWHTIGEDEKGTPYERAVLGFRVHGDDADVGVQARGDARARLALTAGCGFGPDAVDRLRHLHR